MPTVRQQIIDDRVSQTVSLLQNSESEAFERFAHATFTGISIHSFDDSDLVDGTQDKQIDAITIVEDDGEAEIFVLSMKYTNGFSSNAIILMRNGLNWIFNKPRPEIQAIANVPFRDKVLEIRSVLSGYGPSNVSFRCALLTNGLTSEISSEYQQELTTMLQEYDNGTFRSFEFANVGADELVDLVNAAEKKDRRIDANIPIRYDANSPSLIKYHSQGLKGLVCTANARDIAKIVNDDDSGAVFDSNIRRFLGTRGSVNQDILRTCSGTETSFQFWFLNNGITVICDKFDPTTDPDDPHVKVQNMQIINGCQTATALALAAKSGHLKADARVLLRIYETNDPDLVDRIVLSTNNQNKISNRDLKANDSVQVDMEQAFALFNFWYERKTNQYRGLELPEGIKIVSNDIVGQCFLGIVLKRPADARRRKYKVWSDSYDQIFTGQHVEPHVLSVLIYFAVQSRISADSLNRIEDELRRKLAKSGVFHVARVVANRWRQTDSWTQGHDTLRTQIAELQSAVGVLDPYIDEAIEFIAELIETNPAFTNDIDGALKSSLLEREITREVRTT
ncbi:AIPR family protein [Rosistilla oblonga]|uniref:AIPR family protein n=1 Tax=Rosistilla oblonga TaxID=2527990 RepID=UPI003A979042